jgi:hypothetical protein
MNFVDDENLVAVADWCDGEPGNHHFANVVDAGMTGRVDLEHVDVASLRDLDTRVTRATRLRRLALHAVQRLGQYPRGRRLAASSWTGEHERMRDAAARNRVAQRARHRLLADDLIEALWTPFAGEDLIGHGKCKL